MSDTTDPTIYPPREALEQLATRLRGEFVVFDGPDGSGKSTQMRRLARALTNVGASIQTIREPGGTRIGEVIRNIVLDPAFEEMCLETELMLFMGSRAQLVREQILPALSEGYTILADRFLASTFAYQGGLKSMRDSFAGIGFIHLKRIEEISKVVLGKHFPPFRTFVFDIDTDTSLRRMHSGEIARHGGRSLHRGDSGQLFLFGDRMEFQAAQYQMKIRKMYRYLCRYRPRDYVRINAKGSEDAVFRRIVRQMFREYHVKEPNDASQLERQNEDSAGLNTV